MFAWCPKCNDEFSFQWEVNCKPWYASWFQRCPNCSQCLFVYNDPWDFLHMRDISGPDGTDVVAFVMMGDECSYGRQGCYRRVPRGAFPDSRWTIFIADDGKQILAYKPRSQGWEKLTVTFDAGSQCRAKVTVAKLEKGRYYKRVAFLQAWAAHGMPPSKSCIAQHINEDETDDSARNVRWAPQSKNVADFHAGKDRRKETKQVPVHISLGLKKQLSRKLQLRSHALNHKIETALRVYFDLPSN